MATLFNTAPQSPTELRQTLQVIEHLLGRIGSVTATGITLSTAQAVAALQAPWQPLGNTNYQPSPSASHAYDTSAFGPIATWQASTVKIAGNYVKPTAANGYVYVCVTGGTTDAAEPTWPLALGNQVTDNTAVWECRGANVIATAVDLSTTLRVGDPLRVTLSDASYRYALVLGLASDKLGISTGTLLTSDSITAIEVGRQDMLCQIAISPGIDSYNATEGVDLLAQLGIRHYWGLGRAHVVAAQIVHRSGDTGANQPRVAPRIAGTVIWPAAVGAGMSVGTAKAFFPGNCLHKDQCTLNLGDSVELYATVLANNGDAHDFSFVLTVVKE